MANSGISVGEPELFSGSGAVAVDFSGLGGGGGGEICCELAFPGAVVGCEGKNPVFLSAVGRSEAGRKPSPPSDFGCDLVPASKATKPVSGGVSADFG